MLTRDDLIDIIVAGLAQVKAKPAAAAARLWSATGPVGRVFLSEYEIKKRLTPGGLRLTIPKNAILSPLVSDWLTLRGIEVIRELP
ncbi:MAG: hypothetical protein COV48_14825 [Elusimicrobia bacterium CG11_big_fil_rev_8_21_14_0_20_64_6]|nr:MAG: hypothetical protein COV48_14825 [Elusimicrobia bacterium CG11_big_fil_rev_8_21_14_0_20_64_6]